MEHSQSQPKTYLELLRNSLEILMIQADKDCPLERRSSLLSNALTETMLLLEMWPSSDCHDIGSKPNKTKIRAGFVKRRHVAVIWHVEDVQEIRPDLDDYQSWQVLQAAKDRHGCNFGITWDTLSITAEDLYPEQNVTGVAA